MIWVAPSEKDTAPETLEKRLWDAADQFRANSGLIFLRFSTAPFDSLCSPDIVAPQKMEISQIQNRRRTRDLLLPRLLSGDCAINL
jgi:hypothetical protein